MKVNYHCNTLKAQYEIYKSFLYNFQVAAKSWKNLGFLDVKNLISLTSDHSGGRKNMITMVAATFTRFTTVAHTLINRRE